MALGFGNGDVAWVTATGGELTFTWQLNVEVLNPDLLRAPTAVTVSVTNAVPGNTVTFSIDGTTAGTASPDADGYITGLSLAVPETATAGTHTVTATQTGGGSGSDTFTLAQSPLAADTAQGPDAAPVAIAGTLRPQGHYRWVLQDLMPGGLGSWVMPKNPQRWISPVFQRTLSSQHTTATDGQFHITEGMEPVAEFTFSGIATTQAEHDQLMAFWKLNRRFWLIDHRNRAWKVAFTNVDMPPRLRTSVDGVSTDWVHDYTVSAVAYDQDWAVPA